MKLRYQLLVAVLLITLTATSFMAGRRFGSLDTSSQGRSGLTRLVSAMLTGSQASADTIDNVSLSPLETFQQVLGYIRRDYAFPIKDERKLAYAAINGMLASLRDEPYSDRYSRFLEPTDYRGFLDENEGHFGGIGAEIGMREVSTTETAPADGAEASADTKGAVEKETIHCPSCGAEIKPNTKYQLIIVSPLPDSPAEKAGLHAGDRILKIGGVVTDNLGLGDAVKKIKGVPGTVVDLTIGRDGESEPREVKITRSTISVKSAEWKMLPDSIGYLRIGGFNDTTPKLVKTGLAELRSQGMRGLLLDLRNNPGGGLDVCVDVTGAFVGSGPAVYIEERGRPRAARNTPRAATRFDLPLVVLVNGGSASASEILAGAIQDSGVGKIVGVTTFGKGLVQTVFPLPDGSALTLTTARYLTPKLRDINQKGIEPDVRVEQPKTEGNVPVQQLSGQDQQAAEGVRILKSELAAEARKAA
jgi:carboxyl-terminal processing protease